MIQPVSLLFLALLKGVIVGIVIALPVGPVGVLCVRRTIFEGPTFGFVSGMGAAVADTIFGVIAGAGLTVLRDLLLTYQNWFGVVGGIFLLYLGIHALWRPPPERETGPITGERRVRVFFSTFVLAVTNPVTILAFTAIFAQVGMANAGLFGITALVIGVFLGSLLWWLGLSFGLFWLQRLIGIINLGWLNRISGSILAVSGVGLLGAAVKALARI